MSPAKQRFLRVSYRLLRLPIHLYLHGSHRTRVMIVCDGELLLVQSGFGSQHWGLPGGGLNRRETALASAVRETHEEVGVMLQPEQLAPVETRWARLHPNRRLRVRLSFFSVELLQKPDIVLNQPHEVFAAQWVALPGVLSVPSLSPEVLSVIRKFYRL